MPARSGECSHRGFVSIWLGSFPSVEAAESYFGIPDEIGVDLPPDAFAADIGVQDLPVEKLEVNFEQLSPRPVGELLRDATFAPSFRDVATEAATNRGIHEAQGIALLYDTDYRAKAAAGKAAGPLTFIGAFPYLAVPARGPLERVHELAQSIGYPAGAVLFVLGALTDLGKKRRQEPEAGAGPISAREYCAYLLTCRGADTAATLRELRLLRSEDVGRIMFALIEAGLAKRHASDAQADFDGLFALMEAPRQ
jgi:uncharacterized repeat protein (TIGR04138 family)